MRQHFCFWKIPLNWRILLGKQPQLHSPNLNTPIVLSDRPIVIVTIDRLMYQRCRFRTQATLKALEDEQPEGVVVTVNVKTTKKKIVNAPFSKPWKTTRLKNVRAIYGCTINASYRMFADRKCTRAF